ncbi:Hypothetical protein FKW44_013927 [Caligus rogercresseyi]|uniref:Uncharacterized protein n=1 Tax=Caligus rogercresseyi TaxID=217165 RepID=A0A7T8GYH5_CALRO|nr:Hypothetical protein FKW44_013927 [Caligus rogercresseyi]
MDIRWNGHRSYRPQQASLQDGKGHNSICRLCEEEEKLRIILFLVVRHSTKMMALEERSGATFIPEIIF